jgi:hypothetical protein
VLQHREYIASRTEWSWRIMRFLRNALALVVVPCLRFLLCVVPPLGRAIGRSSGGIASRVFRSRDRGDHAAAFSAALEGMWLQERRREGTGELRRHMAEFEWWHFLHLATDEADHLGPNERARVTELLERARAPGGMFAASCLRTIAGWRWEAGDRDSAIALARRMVLADSSWPHGHIFLGWVGLITGRHDPLPHLREALRVDPASASAISANREFADAPGLLRSLGLIADSEKQR